MRLTERAKSALASLSCDDRPTLWAMLALVVYYMITWGAYQGKGAGDGWFGFLYLKAIVFHHSLDMKLVAPEFAPYFGTMGPGNHMPNRCPFGPVILWMPFYLLSLGVEWIARQLHLVTGPTGQAPINIWVTGLSSLIGVLIGWRAVFKLIARYFGPVPARVGAIAAVLATPMLWYAAHHPFYQHDFAFMIIAVLVEYWDRTRGEARFGRFIWLGLIGGYAISVRGQEALYLLIPGGEIVYRIIRGPRRGGFFACGAVYCLAAAVAFFPQALAWIYYTGKLSPPQQEPIRWDTPFLLMSLFSTRGGLFPWSPIMYAATAGLFLVRRASAGARGVILALLAVFAIELYIVSAAWVVSSGFSYGNRRLSDVAILVGLLVGCAYAYGPKKLLTGFLVFCLTFNLLLVELMRRQKIPGSTAYPRSLAMVLDTELHAPKPLVTAAEWIGYPFVQPVGWIWSALHKVKPVTFESVVGTLILEREGQWFTVLRRDLTLNRSSKYYVAYGMSFPNPKGPAQVTGPARVFVPMFASEPVTVELKGNILPGDFKITWNGKPLAVERRATGLYFSIDKQNMEPGTNICDLELPVGSTVAKFDFTPTSRWW